MGWYYVLNGVTSGPVTEPELRSMLEDRLLTLDTPVWTEGMTEWLPFQKSSLCRRVGRWPVAPMRHRAGASMGTGNLASTTKRLLMMPGAASRDPVVD